MKLRDFLAEVGSNLSLNSRKVLWGWVPPYALLAQRASCSNWWSLLRVLRTYYEDTTQACQGSNLTPTYTPM